MSLQRYVPVGVSLKPGGGPVEKNAAQRNVVRSVCKQWVHLYSLGHHCQTPLQLEDPTQLQFVGVGVDFLFPWKNII